MLFFFAVALVAGLAFSSGQALATHVSCGDTITQDTTLDSDLIACPGDGVVIGADNVTLDLNGHTVSGTAYPTAGVRSSSHNRVTIEGGTIDGFGYGVTSSGDYNLIRGLTMMNGGGVHIFRGSHDRVTGTSVSGGGGILVEGGGVLSDVLVDGNVASGTGAGIAIVCFQCSGIEVRRNVVTGGGAGIHLVENPSTTISQNSLFGNRVGIDLCATENNKVQANSVRDNDVGILLGCSSVRTLLERNVVAGNRHGGIVLHDPIDTSVIRNRVSRDGEDGILVEPNANRSLIERNIAYANGDDGIDTDSSSTTLTANRANRNADRGIEAVPGVIDGGGNRAFGNGNPLQCLNIVCR